MLCYDTLRVVLCLKEHRQIDLFSDFEQNNSNDLSFHCVFLVNELGHLLEKVPIFR